MLPSAFRQPALMVLAALLGLLAGQHAPLAAPAMAAVEPCLMALLYVTFLGINGRKLQAAFRHTRFTLAALSLNFLGTPLLAYLVGRFLFPGQTDLQMGIVMLMATPCTDWYLTFTSLAKGNVELGASLLPLNLALQILLLPAYLWLFFGSSATFQHAQALPSMFMVLAVPGLLALATRLLGRRVRRCRQGVCWLQQHGEGSQLLLLCLAIVAMFTAEGRQAVAHPWLLPQMLLPLVLLFSANIVAVRFLRTPLRLNRADTVALHFTTLARNSPLALALAVAAFPDRPMITLALIAGSLWELPALSLVAYALSPRPSGSA